MSVYLEKIYCLERRGGIVLGTHVVDGLDDDGEVGVLERREPSHRVLLQRSQEAVIVVF